MFQAIHLIIMGWSKSLVRGIWGCCCYVMAVRRGVWDGMCGSWKASFGGLLWWHKGEADLGRFLGHQGEA